MATITIRGIDDKLQHRLKMAAVRDKMTMKAWIIVAFERELHREEMELNPPSDKEMAKQLARDFASYSGMYAGSPPAELAVPEYKAVTSNRASISAVKHADSCKCFICKPPKEK